MSFSMPDFNQYFRELCSMRSSFSMAEMTDDVLSVSELSQPCAAIVALLGADRNMAVTGVQALLGSKEEETMEFMEV